MAQEQDLVDLVVTAQAGDVGAFEMLVQRYQDFAYALAFARVGDRQLAQDVAQEAFLQAHRDLQSLREPRAFGAWLRRLVAKHSDRLLRGKKFAITAEQCAAAVARGVERNARTVVTPASGWALIVAQRLFPSLVEAQMKKIYRSHDQ